MILIGFRKNVLLSSVLHCMIIIAVIVILHRGTADPAPTNCMIVSLFKGIANISSKTSPPLPSISEEKRRKIRNERIASPLEANHNDISVTKFTMTADNGHAKEDSIFEVNKHEHEAVTERSESYSTEYRNNITPPFFDKGGPAGFSEQEINVQNTDSLFALIRQAIEKVKMYPFLARKRRIEGIVFISFTVNNKGYPQNIKIGKSSGYEILDSEAIKIVKNAAPLPYVQGGITVPISFRLTD
jgi:TonB family protein